ncbi:V-type proton ATPase subunit e [Monosporozyma servazzii]
MSFYTVVGVFIAVAVASTLFWFTAPKDNRTVWRSTVILTMAMMYLMWAITYLAQLHPLVVPRRSDLRPEFGGE